MSSQHKSWLLLPLPSSHVKTSLIFTTDARVDHKTIQVFPSYVGTNTFRSLQETGNIPVGIVFVPSKAQQDHSPAHTGVFKPPWFPQKEDFPRQVDSALGWRIPNTSHPVVGGPASVWQPCNPHQMWLQHKGLQCSPWKPVLWGYLQRVSFYSLKEKRKVKTTSMVRSSSIVLTPGFLTREEDIQDMANAGFVL